MFFESLVVFNLAILFYLVFKLGKSELILEMLDSDIEQLWEKLDSLEEKEK